MKLTLDHNVIIDLVDQAPNVAQLRQSIAANTCQAYVVEIGASEMRERGIKPDRYDLFEELLAGAGLASLPRLMPIGVWDVMFWDHFIWGDAVAQAELERINDILFGGSKVVDPNDPLEARIWLNRMCDVHTMWCHLHYKNDVFVTSDRNFLKATKLPSLLALGAGRVCLPEDL